MAIESEKTYKVERVCSWDEYSRKIDLYKGWAFRGHTEEKVNSKPYSDTYLDTCATTTSSDFNESEEAPSAATSLPEVCA